MDREAWLETRRSGIGGSDCAIALNLHPYVSPLELYLDKTHRVLLEVEDNERMQMGRALEDAIADVYAQRFDVKLRRSNLMRRHPRYNWMIGHPDRLIEGQRIGLEIKNVDSLAFRFGAWGEEDTDQIPEPYLLQSLHYLIIFDYQEWHVGALVGGNHLKRYIVRRDRELEQMVIDGEAEFWNHVQSNNPPALDHNRPGAVALLKKLHPGTNGETVMLDESMLDWHHMRASLDANVKRDTAALDACKAHILEAMGDSAIGRLPDGSGEYRRKVVDRKGFTVDPTSYVDFRFSKKAKEA